MSVVLESKIKQKICQGYQALITKLLAQRAARSLKFFNKFFDKPIVPKRQVRFSKVVVLEMG